MKRIVASILLVGLSACGGGGSSGQTSAPPPVVNQSVGGIWKGQFVTASGVTVAGVALVAPDGTFYSEAKNLNNGCAELANGSLTTNGDTVSGTAKFAVVVFSTMAGVQTNCTYSDGATSGTETISGSVVQGSSLTLMGAAKTSSGMNLPSSTVTANFDTLYNTASSLTTIGGNYTGPTGVVLTISGSGAIFSQDPSSGCVVNGQVSIINSSYNVYSASVTYSNCLGSAMVLNGVTATGLLTLDNTVSPNLLYAGYSVTLPSGEYIIVVGDATKN